MAEPYMMNTLNMDVSLFKKPDGNVMATLAGIGNMTEGCNMEIMDGQTTMTMVVKSSPSVPGRVRDMFMALGVGRKEEKAKGSNVEDHRMRKEEKKEKETEMKEISEVLEKDEIYDEPKDAIDLNDMSSSQLGDFIVEELDRITEIYRKSENLQGGLNGKIEECTGKILGATVLLKARFKVSTNQLREAKRENARLEEQIKRMSVGLSSPLSSSSPPCKRGDMTAVIGTDSALSTTMDLSTRKGSGILPSLTGEEFPPLPRRLPRTMSERNGGDRKVEKELVGLRDGKGIGKIDKDGNIDGRTQDGDVKVGPRTVLSRKERSKDVAITSAIYGSETLPPLPDYRMDPYKGVASISVTSDSGTEWRLVGGRRRKWRDPPLPPLPDFRLDPLNGLCDAGVRVASDRVERRPPPRQQLKKIRPRLPPLSSAVMITGRAVGFSYAAALRSAREQIDLEAIGIGTTCVRKAVSGGILIEVSGEDSRVKAEELGMRIRGVLKDSAIVSCPTKKCELRVTGFDESVSPDEVARVLSGFGGCSIEDVKIGPIRTSGNGLGTVWVQLPVLAATKLADIERVRLGWTMARVELLKTRPLQCYRCWKYGHVQNLCHSAVDRRGACFKCGQSGHMASTCQNAAHCAVCHDAGLEASHRLGGSQCAAQVQQSTLLGNRKSAMAN